MNIRRNIMTTICLLVGILFTVIVFRTQEPATLNSDIIPFWSWWLLFPATTLLVILSGGNAARVATFTFIGIFIGGCAILLRKPLDGLSSVLPAAFFWTLTVAMPVIVGTLLGWVIAYSGKRWMKK